MASTSIQASGAKMMDYKIFIYNESSDHEMHSNNSFVETMEISASNDRDAFLFTKLMEDDCEFCDEMSEAMGGGCFSFFTSFEGLKNLSKNQWIIEPSGIVDDIENYKPTSFHPKFRTLPSGDIEYADEFGGY